MADGLPDLGLAVGDTVDVPVDPELDGLTTDGRYAVFVPWNGQYSAEATGDERLDAVIELVRRQSDESNGAYTEVLETCAIS